MTLAHTEDCIIDGSVVAYEPHSGGAYVMVAGDEAGLLIIDCSTDDLKQFVSAHSTVIDTGAALDSMSRADRIRVTSFGLKYLAAFL